MQRVKRSSLLALLVAALAGGGCNTPTKGVEGKVLFTPDDCGRYTGCDFADSIGVGGAINVYISGINGFSTAGVTLTTDDPDVLLAAPVADMNGRPTWGLYGIARGVARLVALDPDGDEADHIEVAVQPITGLILENLMGNAVGPLEHDDYDEHWVVNADERIVFYVTPVIGDRAPTMGRFVYVPFIHEESFDSFIHDHIGLNEGHLDFTAPAGEYHVTFYDNFENQLDVLIEVRPRAR